MAIYVLSKIAGYANELAELARAFFPGTIVKIAAEDSNEFTDKSLVIKCHYKRTKGHVEIRIEYEGAPKGGGSLSQEHEIDVNLSSIEEKRLVKNYMKLMLYQLLEELTGRSLEWGALTGIRPTKIVHGLMDKGLDKDMIIKTLYDDYRVSGKKATLLLDIAQVQRPYFKDNHPKKISVYVNIPICTTKCLFCSFPSATIDRCAHLIDDYILALDKEMKVLSRLAREQEMEVEAVYIGGGTPTSLNVNQLEKVLKAVDKYWGYQEWREYTVEGGRPDTMDKYILRLLKDYNVSRISINPQSMNDRTLRLIGRNHRSDQIANCFHMAREVGFDSINMDAIVGLPGEGVDEALHTMEEIKKLYPDNLTVHTLAIKRASRLKESIDDFETTEVKEAEEMMKIFYDGAASMGMRPYYLYRQKYMLGNMENLGFSFPSKESIYNMQIMEDQQTIWAFGAAAITKVCYPVGGRIERAPNVKDIEQYIDRIDEMIERKTRLIK